MKKILVLLTILFIGLPTRAETNEPQRICASLFNKYFAARKKILSDNRSARKTLKSLDESDNSPSKEKRAREQREKKVLQDPPFVLSKKLDQEYATLNSDDEIAAFLLKHAKPAMDHCSSVIADANTQCQSATIKTQECIQKRARDSVSVFKQRSPFVQWLTRKK